MPDADDRKVPDERLAPEEIEAVKEALGERDRTAHGASTMADIAEGAGVSVEEVQAHLRQIRAERSMAAPAQKKPFRIPIWSVAAVTVLVAGFAFWRLALPGIEEERDEAVAKSYMQRQSQKPKLIKGVLVKTLERGSLPVPAGMTAVLGNGKFSIRVEAAKDALPLYEPTAEQRIQDLIKGLMDLALQEPQMSSGKPPPKVYFHLAVANVQQTEPSEGDIPLKAQPGQSGNAYEQERTRRIAGVAGAYLRSFQMLTKTSLEITPNMPLSWVGPPPGYAVDLSGKDIQLFERPIYLLPIAEENVRMRLSLNLQQSVEHLDDPLPDVLSGTADQARPRELPPSVRVRIKGPLSELVFDLPTSPGGQYPTAADLAKAQERIIAEKSAEAARQIAELNARASKQ